MSTQEKHFTIKKDLSLIHIILNEDLLCKSNHRHISIRACCEKNTIKPITANNEDIMLFFLGRLFDETHADIILKLYQKHGIQYVLKKLKGSYAFILLDHSYDLEESVLYVVTDPFNTIPIYYYQEPGTNIVEFTTEYTPDHINNLIMIPQASYCKLTYSNKVTSMWTFDNESYTPKYDNTLKKWIYPSPKFRFHKYRTLHPSHIITNSPQNKLVKQLDQYIRNSIQLRIQYMEEPIVCIGNSNDPEYNYMTKIIKQTHEIIEIDQEKGLEYIKEQIQSSTNPITTVFMSFCIFQTEINNCKDIKNMTESPTDDLYTKYDTDLYKFLDISIPPFYPKYLGVHIEYPLLDESWLQYYLSIPPKIRYTESLLSTL